LGIAALHCFKFADKLGVHGLLPLQPGEVRAVDPRDLLLILDGL
jgi:hypothetical protein